MIEYLVDSALDNSNYPLSTEFFIADVDGEEGKTFKGGDDYQESNAQRRSGHLIHAPSNSADSGLWALPSLRQRG